MSNLIRKIIVLILFLVSSELIYAQKNLEGFTGNIKIIDTSLEKIVNGFYNYLLDKGEGKKINSVEYFVGISIVCSNDNTYTIEITLSSYALSRPSVKKLPGFYGFLRKDDIYFIFWNKSKYLKQINKTPNPNVFEKFKKPSIVSPYDPYKWEVVLKKGAILDMSPKETIEKYIIIKPQ
jgi:hypothetical protein